MICMLATDKSRVEKNASTSILLKAPVEVRDNILRLVLGDRMVHIQYLSTEDLAKIGWTEPSNTAEKQATGSLCSSFCVAEKSEQEAYDEANQSSGEWQAAEDPDHIPTCNGRHKHCLHKHWLGGGVRYSEPSTERLQAERLTFNNNLTVLAVCRLLYEESNNVLLQTNTFSFHDSQSFAKFHATMNPAQKHKLTKIHISLDVLTDERYFDRWSPTLKSRILTPMKNLEVLHLSFDQYCDWYDKFDRHAGAPDSHAVRKTNVFWAMYTILGLQSLPWQDMGNANRGKHVTVIVSDDYSTCPGHFTQPWTRTQKLEAAELLRALLAAPNSMEIHKAEIAARITALEEGERRMWEEEMRKERDR